jgi:hypothetical protein
MSTFFAVPKEGISSFSIFQKYSCEEIMFFGWIKQTQPTVGIGLSGRS